MLHLFLLFLLSVLILYYLKRRRLTLTLDLPAVPPAPAFNGLPTRVRAATLALAARLDEAGILFCAAGAAACNAHGHRRATQGVKVLLSRERLRELPAVIGGKTFPRTHSLREKKTRYHATAGPTTSTSTSCAPSLSKRRAL